MAMDVRFSKMNGLGNKIIVADMRGRADKIASEAAVTLAADPGTNFDQIMELRDSGTPEVVCNVRILNADGSEAEACGNGTRCVVHFLANETDSTDMLFRTKPGLLVTKLHEDGLVSVDMGIPRFEWDQIPLSEEFHNTRAIELQIGPIDAPVLHTPSVVSMGNPHCIFWVTGGIYNHDLERFGPMLENHPLFPERANITLAEVMSPDHIEMRTWERGAGLTLACGSGACATLVAGVRKELCERKARLTVPGGDLFIEWMENNHVMMTGPAEFEASGLLDPATGAFAFDETPSSRAGGSGLSPS